MFETEANALQLLHQTSTVRVPEPLFAGTTSRHAFLVLERLSLGGQNNTSQERLGQQLAALHRVRSDNQSFGFEVDNFIGATPQPNSWSEDWIEFLRNERFGHMLNLCGDCGYAFRGADQLLENIEQFFDEQPSPSLLHGDLWGGNASALPDGTPVIFDPASYFGDREADLAMTRLFGGFSPAFYAAYQESWPLSPGHEQRITLYNLYHILNHAVLFGGSYARQAQEMIATLCQAL